MGRVYAGVLGPLAFATSLVRGIVQGGGTESVLWTAWYSLLGFAAAGYVLGWMAERTVEESVAGRMAAQFAARKAAR